MLPTRGREPGYQACLSERGTPPADLHFDVRRYRELLPDARRLVNGWASKAYRTLDRTMQQGPGRVHLSGAFEAFIYAWISLNGWAACCCGTDSDRQLIQLLAREERLDEQFRALKREDASFAEAVGRFGALWPIFRSTDVQSVRDVAAQRHADGGRDELIRFYVDTFPHALRAPECHLRHRPEQLEATWGHVLQALYRVRCNLFHGAKSMHSEADKEIVETAAAVLVPLVTRLLKYSNEGHLSRATRPR